MKEYSTLRIGALPSDVVIHILRILLFFFRGGGLTLLQGIQTVYCKPHQHSELNKERKDKPDKLHTTI